jgi:hypothetical protein
MQALHLLHVFAILLCRPAKIERELDKSASYKMKGCIISAQFHRDHVMPNLQQGRRAISAGEQRDKICAGKKCGC